MIQAGSPHLSLQEKKWSFTEFHSKHLEAAFDHNNTESATSDPAIPATGTFQNRKKFSLLFSFIC